MKESGDHTAGVGWDNILFMLKGRDRRVDTKFEKRIFGNTRQYMLTL